MNLLKKTIIVMLVLSGVYYYTNAKHQNKASKVPLKLENFEYIDEGKVRIDVNDGEYNVVLLTFNSQPSDIKVTIFKEIKNKKHDYKKTDSKGILDIKLAEYIYNQPNVVVYLNNNDIIGYIELLRQSKIELNKLFDFEMENGYTVLGRTDLLLPEYPKFFTSDTIHSITSSRPYPSEEIKNFYPDGKLEAEIREVVGLIRYLWSEPIKIGPTNRKLPKDTGLLTRLEMLRNGEWSTQCSDFRDIFNNLLLRSGVISKVRRVELRQYYPPYKDLIANSHSISEIYVTGLKKWIAVDSWYGYLFKLNGNYLNSKEIALLPKESYDKINIEKLLHQRNILTDLSDNGKYVALTYGYFGFFGSIEYGPERAN